MAAAPAVLHVAREGGGFASLTAARDAIRSLTADDACPTAIGGEPHQDSVLFSAALWSVRAKLGALDQLSGQGVTASQGAAFGAGSQFGSTMFGQGLNGVDGLLG